MRDSEIWVLLYFGTEVSAVWKNVLRLFSLYDADGANVLQKRSLSIKLHDYFITSRETVLLSPPWRPHILITTSLALTLTQQMRLSTESTQICV
jgi:hypothetical protein